MCIGIKTEDPIQRYRTGTTKQKDSNNEESKEKAKDAARTRRRLEFDYFQKLEKLLPITATSLSSQQACLDKTSIIRLNVAQLKVKDVLKNGIQLLNGKGKPMPNVDLFSCLDGFSLVIGCGGDVIYVSENVCRYIGLTQVELLGQQFGEYVHPCDHNQLDRLNPRRFGSTDDQIEIFVRVKCTVTERGRMVSLKQAGYKSLKISGKTCHMPRKEIGGVTGTVFIGLARCVMEREVILDNQIGLFTTKHSVDMKFIETNQWLSKIAGYISANDLSFYDLVHGQDIENVQISFKNLVDHGQCETPLYRLLCHGGGYVWLQTKAFLTTSRLGTEKRQSILCTHQQISEVLNREQILSIVQMKNKPNIDKNLSHEEDHIIRKHVERSNGHEAGTEYLFESMSIEPRQNPNPPIITSCTENKIVNTPTSVIVSCVKTPPESTSVPGILKTGVPDQNKEFLTRGIHSEDKCLIATTQSVFKKSDTLQGYHNTSELLENLLPIMNLNHEHKLESDENSFLDDILYDMEKRSPYSGDQFVAIENKDYEKERQTIEASFDNIPILNFDEYLKPIENLTFNKSQVLNDPIENALWDTDRKHMDPYDNLHEDKIIMLGKTGKQDTEEQESDRRSSVTKVMENATNMDSLYKSLNQAEDFGNIRTHSKVYSEGNTKLNMTTQCIFERNEKIQELQNSPELLEESPPIKKPNSRHELESGDNDFLDDILNDMERHSPHSGEQCVSIQNKDHEKEKIINIGAENVDNIQGLNFDDNLDAREFLKPIKHMTFTETQALINPSTNTMWDTGRQSDHLEHNRREPGHSIWNGGARKRRQSDSTICPEHLQSRTTLDQKQRFGRNFSESWFEQPGDKILLWGKTEAQHTDKQESDHGLLSKRFKFSAKSKQS